MKRLYPVLSILVLFSLACSLVGLIGGGEGSAAPTETPPQSEKRCGDGVCDGPENANNCPQDCAYPQGAAESPIPTAEQSAGYGILYQASENSVTTMGNCNSFNLMRFLDAGYVKPDGSENIFLDLKDNPTGKVASKKRDRYFYISTPLDPLIEIFGVSMFNWDVKGQTLWTADFANGAPQTIPLSDETRFPGNVAAAPGNRYLLYPSTISLAQERIGTGITPRLNPFLSDSSLVIVNLLDDAQSTVLANQYNRLLFDKFADFSLDGRFFYTLAREGEGFRFVEIALESGAVTDFRVLFPSFNWDALDWSAWLPPENDFSFASFALSPDKSRLIAYKSKCEVDMTATCTCNSTYSLWVLNLEQNTIETYRNQPGNVSDADWKTDSSSFALALNSGGGCYPDYLDASIELFDKDGHAFNTLLTEPKSKITTLGWLPNGNVIVYDVYSTDYIGRLKLVDTSTQKVTEVINTQDLGYSVSQTNPVTLLFADWVSGE